jgi:hypothetical protein
MRGRFFLGLEQEAMMVEMGVADGFICMKMWALPTSRPDALRFNAC